MTLATPPDIDLKSERFVSDTYGYIEELRSQGSFAKTADARVFFNQSDAVHIMACRDFRFSFVEIDERSSPYLAEAIKYELLNLHGEPHARMRRLVGAALRDRVADDLRTQIVAAADELIDQFPESGVVDLVTAFADPLPGMVLGPMYGIPYTDAADLNEWIQIGGRKLDALQAGEPIAEIEDANRKVHDYLRALLVERRANLGSDIFSELIMAEVDGDRLAEDELVYLASELASAGVDTTRAQLPLILLMLLQHRDQWDLLCADPSLAMGAVDEGMRFAPLPWVIPHAALHDFTWNGIDFAEGDVAMVLVPALNRDPAAMERPQVFDITRARTRNFSFGQGPHACPAAQLARVEMALALERLVRRWPSMRLVSEPSRAAIYQDRLLPELKVEI